MSTARQPEGAPNSTGGQFAASAKNEPVLAGDLLVVDHGTVTVDPIGSCPDCGAEMPGRIGTVDRGAYTQEILLPGTTCDYCPHHVTDYTVESDPDDEGYWYEVTLDSYGELTCHSYDPDGDHVGVLWQYTPGHPEFDAEAKAFHTSSDAVLAGLQARDDYVAYQVNDEVFWTDPDNGQASGWRQISGIEGEIVTLDDGTEAYFHEISHAEPDPTGGQDYNESVEECVAAGQHLMSCDNDGYCNFCGHQD